MHSTLNLGACCDVEARVAQTKIDQMMGIEHSRTRGWRAEALQYSHHGILHHGPIALVEAVHA